MVMSCAGTLRDAGVNQNPGWWGKKSQYSNVITRPRNIDESVLIQIDDILYERGDQQRGQVWRKQAVVY